VNIKIKVELDVLEDALKKQAILELIYVIINLVYINVKKNVIWPIKAE
jgi:hypothetical protein